MSSTGKVSVGTPSRLRSFDPVRLADLECRAWVGYYLRRWPRVLAASVGLVRVGFGMGWYRTLRGAWLVLHLLNRRTLSGPLGGRVSLLLLALGVLAAVDASAELAYLVIPKKEEFAAGGCCTQAFDDVSRESRLVPPEWVEDAHRPWLYGLYFALNGATVLSLFGILRFGWTGKSLLILALMVALTVGFNALFLVEAAAPLLLRLPYHHCPYDLLPMVPESMGAIGLFVLDVFLVIVGWPASSPDE